MRAWGALARWLLVGAGIARDHRRLQAFVDADVLVEDLYGLTRLMPAAERFGLQAQLRRAAVSVPTNIVEGAARHSESEYCRFLEIAHGSARECEYLLKLAGRLALLEPLGASALANRYSHVAAKLYGVMRGLRPSSLG